MGLLSKIKDVVSNPLAVLGPAVLGTAGDLYSAQQQAKNVEKANATNVYLAGQEMQFNMTEAEKARQFSAAQAKGQMDFQERMSNTQYQRAMSDMKAAGLNPMLAYAQGGAGAPGGAMGSAPSASGDKATVTPVPSVMANVMSGARDMVRMFSELRSAYSSWKNIDAKTLNTAMDTNLKAALIGMTGSDTGLNLARIKALDLQNWRLANDVEWEKKHPGFNKVLDQIQRRLPIVNSAAMLMGKAKGMINMDQDSGYNPGFSIPGISGE